MFTRFITAVTVLLLLSSCSRFHTTNLADDSLAGRNNNTAGSVATQNYLIALMSQSGAVGLNGGATGDAAFKQPFTLGTNILGMIPGTDLADEYLILGAHYDHLGSCVPVAGASTVCNGATDNATGVAEVLDIALYLGQPENRPRRSVILAFWDREEDGLLGSLHYAANPLVPLASTVAYINFDIQGSNLLPSLSRYSIAVGAETGGQAMVDLVDEAIATEPLNVVQFSEVFGQGRSDHAALISVGVPSVFFTDSTGPCYHTAGDDLSVVDFIKLFEQTRIALALTQRLANDDVVPTFNAARPLATFDDAVSLNNLIQLALPDIGRFTPSQQALITAHASTMAGFVADGEAQFGQSDLTTMLFIALDVVSLLSTGECDGFLAK